MTIIEKTIRAGAIGVAVVSLLAIGRPAAAQDKPAKEPVVPTAHAAVWSDAADLRRVFTGADVVKRFLNEIVNEGDLTAPDIFVVVEFRFVDLDGDGSLELVALTDVSGRAFFNNVAVVYASDRPQKGLETEFDGFALHDLAGFDVDRLDSVVRDLDHDGRPEIVIPEVIGEFAGLTQPNAVLPEVYVWEHKDFVKASARYQAFYRDEVLPGLERELEKLKALPAADDASERAERRARRDVCEREIAEARKRVPPK